jgi:pimeloyl-ACP methyl ester carboxylesterase
MRCFATECSKASLYSALSNLIIYGVTSLLACLATPTALAVNSSASRGVPHEIHEAMFVSVGGIDQWITIQSTNSNNAVVLLLHGGPGNAWSPYTDTMFPRWENDFTLVQWDQRGAGRTYGKNGGPAIESTMTLDRMVQDGIEVSAYLAKRLEKKKIILVGGSWGSILSVHMAKQRPDLFCAYVGMAQVVNVKQSEKESYDRVLEMARRAGDQPSVSSLESLGPPPWTSIRQFPAFRKALLPAQAKIATAEQPTLVPNPEYASDSEIAQYREAADFSFVHFVGFTMDGPLEHVDLPVLGAKFGVPIFIIQGQEDLTAPPDIARAYLDSLHAPQKGFFEVPGTGHEPSRASTEQALKVLEERAKPLCAEPTIR